MDFTNTRILYLGVIDCWGLVTSPTMVAILDFTKN